MPTVLIVAGFAVLYMMIQQRNTSAAAAGVPTAGQTLAHDITNSVQLASLKLRSSQPTAGRVSGIQIGQTAAGAGVAAATAAESAAGIGISTTLGAVTFGAGLAIAPIFMLLSAHSARAKGARNENAGVGVIVDACDADFKLINAAYNSKQIDGQTAINALMQVHDNYWAFIAQYKGQPGVGNQGQEVAAPITLSISGNRVVGYCDKGNFIGSKTCTAGCSVGNNNIDSSIQAFIFAIQHPGQGLVTGRCEVFGDKYGLADRPSYQLTWN